MVIPALSYCANVVPYARTVKILSYTAATTCYNVLLFLITNRTICNVFKPRLIANCAFFFMVFRDSFFPNTGSDMDDVFCPSTNFISVGIKFKYSFMLRSKKIVQFKLHKITSDKDVKIICDSLKQGLFSHYLLVQEDSPVT